MLFSLCMERCDHAAVTMDHGVMPRKVVRESLGFSRGYEWGLIPVRQAWAPTPATG